MSIARVGSLWVALALAGGCGFSMTPSQEPSQWASPTATPEPLVQQSFAEISFQIPASWSVTRPWGGGRYGPELWLTSVGIESGCEPVQFYPRESCFVTSRRDLAPRSHATETGVLAGRGVVIAFIGGGPVLRTEVPATPVLHARDTSLECKALGGRELTWVVRFGVIDACVGGPVAKDRVEDMIASIVVIPDE